MKSNDKDGLEDLHEFNEELSSDTEEEEKKEEE